MPSMMTGTHSRSASPVAPSASAANPVLTQYAVEVRTFAPRQRIYKIGRSVDYRAG